MARRRASTPPERVASERMAPKKRTGNIKERTHQFSLYIEPEVYDVLRGIAFEERIKLHALITEGVDLVLKKRGSPSIRELIRKAG